MSPNGLHALIRFGLGPRPDQEVPRDGHAWVLAQIRPLPALPGPSAEEFFQAARMTRMEGRRFALDEIIRAEHGAWARRVLATEDGFAERWVQFWANHLAVSRRAAGVAAVGAHHHLRTAIRPHAFGRFEDMLLASHRHAAMLAFMDHPNAAAPGSAVGRRLSPPRPMVENLARETMELHTIGREAGYTQADVEQLSLLLSGWGTGRDAARGEPPGEFVFRPAAHEPGPKALLGRSFPEGEEGGVAALRFLASHPATHRHLARKLAAHFVADAPPPAAVAAIERALAASGGDLAAAARAIAGLEAAWRPLTVTASGLDYAIGLARLLGMAPEGAVRLIHYTDRVAQPFLGPYAPTGWLDGPAAWATPDQVLRRLEVAAEVAAQLNVAAEADPGALLTLARGALVPEQIREAVAACAACSTLREGYFLALSHPGMHRR